MNLNATITDLNQEDFKIATPFKVFILNAAIAILLAKELKIDENIIDASLEKELDMNLRMQIVKKNDKIFLADCYNANPNSMEAAIEFWKYYKQELPHYAILGDMLELGKLSENYHKSVGKQLEKVDSEKIISVGDLAKLYKSDFYFEKVEDFIESDIISSFKKDSVVLLKASHGIHLEKIIAIS